MEMLKGEMEQQNLMIQHVTNVTGENQVDVKEQGIAIGTLQTVYNVVCKYMFSIKQVQDSLSTG